ncbi:MAG: hypothetical protein ACYDBV_10810 [Nitrospiria bacterium]
MSTIKRWIITGIFFGVGLAIAICVIFGGSLWHEGKPKPPKSWNTEAIVATYDSVGTEREDNAIYFSYILENNTNLDYRISDKSSVELMATLKEQKSLIDLKGDWSFEVPVFIPAKQRLKFGIKSHGAYEKKLARDATEEERKKFKSELKKYLNEKAPNLNGFVLFDDANKYEIDFPKGW